MKYAQRFLVPDLLPPKSSLSSLRAIFIGESPHRDEVLPEDSRERTPFRGIAGREWWAELTKFQVSPVQTRPVPNRKVLLEICAELQFALMNAVQFPIDPKITLHQGAKSSPHDQLGFEKGAGATGYKAVYKEDLDHNPVRHAILDLTRRLCLLKESHAQIVCLGNDSRWFVERAMELLPSNAAVLEKPLLMVPHPSSWWRKASYRTRAVDVLKELLGKQSLKETKEESPSYSESPLGP